MQDQSGSLSNAALDPFFHELRTSLTLIHSCTELLMSARVSDPQELREFLEIIQRGGGRIDRLVHDFITLSKAEAGLLGQELRPNTEPTVVQGPINLALIELQPDLQNHEARVVADLQEDLPPALIAPEALKTIVERVIRVALRLLQAPGADVVVQGVYSAGAIELVITAEGPPLSESDLGHVFDRFFMPASLTPRRQQQSLGLNMPVALALAQIFDGTIAVESVAFGNVFTLRLPAVGARSEERGARSEEL
jgi:signal transduction histidine kinase